MALAAAAEPVALLTMWVLALAEREVLVDCMAAAALEQALTFPAMIGQLPATVRRGLL
jgi:hypothetical protein